MDYNHYIHLRQLQYFIDAAECLSFTKAAEKNHIAQTAMSQNIINIERQLGLKLFKRTRHYVVLTESGKSFYADARHLLTNFSQAVTNAWQIENGCTGILTIGFQGLHEKKILPELIRKFRKQHPDIQITLIQDSIQNLSQKLETNELDLIFTICFEPFHTETITERIVSSEPICAVLPQDHYLSGKRKVKRNVFSNDPVIFVNPKISEYTFKAMIRDCQKTGFIPNITTYTSDVESALMLVSAGMGITFFPKCCCEINPGLTFIDLDEDSRVEIVARFKKDTSNPAVFLFEQILNHNVSR